MAIRDLRRLARWVVLFVAATAWVAVIPAIEGAAASEAPFEAYEADWLVAGGDWAREGYWSITPDGLVHDLKEGNQYGLGDTLLKGRLWTNPVIEAEVSVQEYGQFGSVRLMFGWQSRWEGYAVTFSSSLTTLYRFDGSSGRYKVLGQGRVGLEVGKRHRVRVTVNDARFEVFIDDERVLTAADPEDKYPAGFVGIKASNFVRATVHAWKVSGQVMPAHLPASLAQDTDDAGGSAPIITGTFLQPDSTSLSWNEATWRREFEAMRAIGIDTLILQWVGNRQRQEMYYPSEVMKYGHRLTGGSDFLKMLLDLSAESGIDMWVGAYRDGGFAQRLAEDAEMNRLVMEEVARLYGDHPAFAGWYVTNEITMLDSAPVSAAWASHLATLVRYARQATPEKPVAIAPGLRISVWRDTEAAAEYWTDFLRTVQPDVIMLQDGMGLAWRSGFTADDLRPYYRAMNAAARAAGVAFWNDLENFITDSWEAADIERVIQQIEATAPYVDKIVIFEFNHYMSPVRFERLARLGSLSARKAIQQYEGYKLYLSETAW